MLAPGELPAALRLLLVTDDALLEDRNVVDVCRAAIVGGATAVQLRLKHAGDRDLLTLARELVQVLAVPVFVNDRLDIALASGAAGVHLGPDDLDPALARRVVPRGFVIGASVGVAAEIGRGQAADYWGVGPLRLTPTKRDAGTPLGLAGAARIVAAAAGRPCVLIGGVDPGDVEPARAAGFAGVAVIRGVLAERDVEAAARRYRMSREG